MTKLQDSGAIRRRCNMSHAQKRGMERYHLSIEDFEDVVGSIVRYYSDGSSRCVKYIKSDGFHANRQIYLVQVRDFVVPVVWCETTRSPVTFLPLDFLKTVASERVPENYQQCLMSIDAVGKELSRIAIEISKTPRESDERIALQAVFKEKTAELNRLKLLRDTHYEVTAEMRDQSDDPVFLIGQLANICRELLFESGQQAEDGSAMQFVLSSARKYLKSYGK